MSVLIEVWNKNFWNKPLRMLVLAVVVAPLGGFIDVAHLRGLVRRVRRTHTRLVLVL
jgi:hypothetical protein